MPLASDAVILFGSSFAAALGFGYGVTWLRKPKFAPLHGSSVRLACPRGSMRTRLISAKRSTWIIDAPLFRDAYVPLRPGETLKFEIPGDGGVWTGLVQVVRRDSESKQIEVKQLGEPRRLDRRADIRKAIRRPCRLDGAKAIMLDISKGGACLSCPGGTPALGDRVRVDNSLAYVVNVDPVKGLAHLLWMN